MLSWPGAPRSQSHWGLPQSMWKAPLNCPSEEGGAGASVAHSPSAGAAHRHAEWTPCHAVQRAAGGCCVCQGPRGGRGPTQRGVPPHGSRRSGHHCFLKQRQQEHLPGAWVPAVAPWTARCGSQLQPPALPAIRWELWREVRSPPEPEHSRSAPAAPPGEGVTGTSEGWVLSLEEAGCPLVVAAWALPTGGS